MMSFSLKPSEMRIRASSFPRAKQRFFYQSPYVLLEGVLRAAADIDQALGAWHLLAVAPVSGVGVEVEYLALAQLRAPEVSPLDIDKAELIFSSSSAELA